MPTLCPPGPKPAPKRARKTMIQIGKNPIKLAEREGFEPSVPVTQYARLAIWCLRPLGHLSAPKNRRIIACLCGRRNIRNTIIARQCVFLVSSSENRCRQFLNRIGRRLREIVAIDFQPDRRRRVTKQMLTSVTGDPAMIEKIARCPMPRREKGRGRRYLRALLFVKLVEQGLGILQIGGIEALREPVVDFGKHRARLVVLTLLRQQARETRRRAQLP